MASRLSDCYPRPEAPMRVEVDPEFVNRYMGREVSAVDITNILGALEMEVRPAGGKLSVSVPSFRATKDISIEADVIEEIARCVGYDNIEPVLPEVEVRCFEPNAEHTIERKTLDILCLGLGYCEVQLYIWYDEEWTRKLGYEIGSAIELRNPAAAGQQYLRHTLLPGLLAAAERNRRYLDEFKLCEIGSVFPGGAESTNSATGADRGPARKMWKTLARVTEGAKSRRGRGNIDGRRGSSRWRACDHCGR
jgi:phenylalanyl-tRNA synthetase beta chain